MKAKLCKYISYGFNRQESIATSSINEMSSASPRPAKPSPDQLQAQYTNHRERNIRCLLHSSVKERGKKHAVEKMHSAKLLLQPLQFFATVAIKIIRIVAIGAYLDKRVLLFKFDI